MLIKHSETLLNCQLFKSMTLEEINDIFDKVSCKIGNYKKSETIFDEGDDCNSLGIILKGKIELSTYFISGDVSSLITLNPSGIFGEAILFSSKEHYPISVTSNTVSEVLFLTKAEVMSIIEISPKFLENYLLLLSSKLLFFNDKFKLLSLSTIRGKIAHVLIKLSKEQNSLTVKLPFSKEKMALHICTRRPSLSRELSKMKHDGLIDYDKSIIKILDYDALTDELF